MRLVGVLFFSSILLAVTYNNCGEKLGNLSTGSDGQNACSAIAPNAPSNFAATAISSLQINLTWSNPNSDAITISRSNSATGTFTQIAALDNGATNYQDTGLNATTAYYYRVYAFNCAGAAFSEANAATLATPPPTAPSNLFANGFSQTQINLTWNDNSSDETNFKIERASSANGPFAALATLNPGVTSYQDAGINSYVRYFYRVYAIRNAVSSNFTTVANAATMPPANTNAFINSVTVIPTGARVVISGPAQALRYFHDFSNGVVDVLGVPPYISPMDVTINFPAGTTFICFQARGTNVDGNFYGSFVGDPQQCNSVP